MNRVGSITRDGGRQLCLSASTQLSFPVFSEAFEDRKVLDENWKRSMTTGLGRPGCRELRGAHLPALGPAARPFLRAEEGSTARPQQGNAEPEPEPESQGPQRPKLGRSGLSRRGLPVPPPRRARPLTFTFPASRRPSHPRRH